MGVLTVQSFKRYEEKYLVTKKQADALESRIQDYVEIDRFGAYWVQSLYYDTRNWDVVQRSIEKPVYKEKLRLRCYGVPDQEDIVFVEIKKKYRGLGYKRRIGIKSHESACLGEALAANTTQIGRELNFYWLSHELNKRMYVGYRRTAYSGIENVNLRVTFDRDIHYRTDRLDFASPGEGTRILCESIDVVEIKSFDSIPLWLSRILCEEKIWSSSFSKYGRSFIDYKGLRNHA